MMPSPITPTADWAMVLPSVLSRAAIVPERPPRPATLTVHGRIETQVAAGTAGGGEGLPRLPAMGEGDADRVRRRQRARRGDAGRRAAGRPGRSSSPSFRRA